MLPMVEPGKKPSLGASPACAGSANGWVKSASTGRTGKVRESPLERRAGIAQVLSRNIDWHVGGRRYCIEQERRLRRASRTRFDHNASAPNPHGDLVQRGPENPDLCPGRVIFGQASDFVEQLAPPPVVEPACRDHFGLLRQTCKDIAAKLLGKIMPCRLQMGIAVGHYQASLASLRPVNCQRWWGWKKLR
jgi:hypothetical protein